MAALNEETLKAAMAPGVAKAKEICEAVAQDLAGDSAESVHAELVKRLQAEPFEWDDERLQELATAISSESKESNESEDAKDSGESRSSESEDDADTDRQDFASKPVDPDAGTADARADPGDHEAGAGDATPSAAGGATGGATPPQDQG